MTATACIYSPLNARPPADVVAQVTRGARVRETETGPTGWRALTVSGGGLELRLVAIGLDDERLMTRIDEGKRKIVGMTANGPTGPAFRLRRFVGRARSVVELEGFDIEKPVHRSFLLDYARLVHGVAQVAPGFLDSEARWILDRRGASDPKATPRPFPEAEARRTRSIAALGRAGVGVPEGLSLVESEDEALTCDPGDAKLRALALYRTFRETCGAPELAVEVDESVREAIEALLTPREREAIAGGDRTLGGMGVEAIWTLLFVLGAIPALGPLGAPCSAEAMLDALDEFTSRGALDGGELRPLPEILDALDAHQCLAWALADTRGKLPAPMHGLVIQWRLRALRWAVLDQYAEWDQVSLDA